MAKWPFNLFGKAEKTAENAGPTWLERLCGAATGGQQETAARPSNHTGKLRVVEGDDYNRRKPAKKTTQRKPVKKAATQRKGLKSAHEVKIERLQAIVRDSDYTNLSAWTGISKSVLSRFANGHSNGSEETRRYLCDCDWVQAEYASRYGVEL